MRHDSIIEQQSRRAEIPRGIFLRAILIDYASARTLVLTTLPLVLLASALLIGPGQVYSREMTWDLLFNLDGAWRMYTGQIAHVDFHTELGSLPFLLTELAMRLTGPSVLAVPVGECLFAGVVLVLCTAAVQHRLPMLPAFVCIVLCTFMVLMPMTYGDRFGAYSFAMVYNRFGWSLSVILYVVLFIPSHRPSWRDCCLGFTLLVLLYYIKATYFGVGMAALVLAMILPGEVRRNRAGWISVLLAMCAVASFNRAYLADILAATAAGGLRTGVAGFADKFIADPAEYAVALTGCLLLAVLPRPFRTHVTADWASPAFGLFIASSGPVLLSQNSQTHGIPTYHVISLLLYCAVRDLIADRRPGTVGQELRILFAPLVFPVLAAAASGVSLAHYCYAQLAMTDQFSAAVVGNLSQLAVPKDDFSRLDGNSADPNNYVRPEGLRYELSQSEYVMTLRDLWSLWREAVMPGAGPRILIVDRVNAMPFVLGSPAPRGVDIWWGDEWGRGLIARPGEEVFADVDYVAIPRYPTKRRTTCDLLLRFGEYLAGHFSPWRNIPDWLVLRRRPPSEDTREPLRTDNEDVRRCLNYGGTHPGY